MSYFEVRTVCTDPPDGYKEETAGKGIWRKGSEGREGKLGSKNTNVYASVRRGMNVRISGASTSADDDAHSGSG